jgi:hypothetical protein
MLNHWDIESLDVNKLLKEWRWLCHGNLCLVARNAYGDLFLRDDIGRVFRLDVGVGTYARIADSHTQFLELANQPENREEWFADSDEHDAFARGLEPGPGQCIGFSTPIVFEETGSSNSAYIADLYDHVGFLGDLHRQITGLPDGAKVNLIIKR